MSTTEVLDDASLDRSRQRPRTGAGRAATDGAAAFASAQAALFAAAIEGFRRADVAAQRNLTRELSFAR